MARRGPASSYSMLPIMAAGLSLLAVGIALTVAFSPDKPEAPPSSEIRFDERPASRNAENDRPREAWNPRVDRQGGQEALASTATEIPEIGEVAPQSGRFTISGMVVDGETGGAVADAGILVERIWTTAEERAWSEENQAAVRARDDAAIDALAEEAARLRVKRGVRSDAEGRFLAQTDEPGAYRVIVRAADYAASTTDAGAVSDEEPLIDLRITLARGASIEGRVMEQGTSLGVPDLTVTIEERPEISAITDAEGMYRISGLEPGIYGVLVVTANTRFNTETQLPYKRVEIKSVEDRQRNVDFSLEAGGVIWGYVTTPDREAVSGADVVLSSSESFLSQALSAAITQTTPVNDRSDEEGYYELLGVPLNKEWRVYATSEAYTPQLADPIALSGSNKTVRVDLFMFGGTTINGFVVDNRGEAIPEAQVVCFPAYTKLVSPIDTPQAFRRATTDDGGAFTISKVPEGNYQIMARKEGYKFAAFGEPIYPDGYSDINNFRIVLTPVDDGTSRVWGTVVNQDGQPVSGADCRLEGMGSDSLSATNRTTSTDSRGQFSFDGVEVGSYRLRVSAEGYAPRTIPRALIDAENKVMLENSAMLVGRVLVRETRRAPETSYTVRALPLSEQTGSVNLFQLNEGRMEETFDSEDGSFQLAVPPGFYQLEGRAEGLTPGRIQVSAGSGEVVDGLEIFLSTEGGVIEGRVRTMGGDTPEGATVNLLDLGSAAEMAMSGGEGSNTMRVGADGFFSFSNLAAGTYNVIAEHPSYANGSSGPITLGEAESRRDIEIRLGSGGVLNGTVTRNNEPLAGALVLIVSAETGTTRSVNTDAGGFYEVDDLASGTYEVTVTQLSSGNVTDLFGRMGGSVEVVEGQVATLDFGGTGGVRVTGSCVPGPPGFGGEVMLRAPGSPLIAGPGEPIQIERLFNMNSLYRVAAAPGSGYFEIENVMPGIYQIEVYYILNVFTGDVRNVYAGQIEIPDTPAIDVPLMVDIR